MSGSIAREPAAGRGVRDEATRLRGRFLEPLYCFSASELEGRLAALRDRV